MIDWFLVLLLVRADLRDLRLVSRMLRLPVGISDGVLRSDTCRLRLGLGGFDCDGVRDAGYPVDGFDAFCDVPNSCTGITNARVPIFPR